MILFATLSTLLGTVLLCASMKRHFKQLWPHKRYSQLWTNGMKVVGWLLTIAGALCYSLAQGAGLGLTQFFATLTFVVIAIALWMAFKKTSR